MEQGWAFPIILNGQQQSIGVYFDIVGCDYPIESFPIVLMCPKSLGVIIVKDHYNDNILCEKEVQSSCKLEIPVNVVVIISYQPIQSEKKEG